MDKRVNMPKEQAKTAAKTAPAVSNANLLEDKKFINLAQTMQELDDAIAAIKAKRGDKFASMRTQYVMAYNQRKAQIKGAAK